MTLSATIRAGIKAEHTKALDLGTASFDLNHVLDFALSSGTGAGQADLMFTDTRTLLGPGGVFLWACPADASVTVTASTGDLLTVTNSGSGTSVTYQVVILGCSA